MLVFIIALNTWLFPFVCGFIVTNEVVPGYTRWTPRNTTREYLFCPYETNAEGYSEEACSCKAKPCWDFTPHACGASVTIQTLWLEYEALGKAKIVEINTMPNYTVFFSLRHTFGRLREVPSNICQWRESLITLDLSDNVIGNISILKCMRILDTLILDNNIISDVSNDTFGNMDFVRILNMRNNKITTLEPNTLRIKSGNIFHSDFSGNDVITADISDIFRTGPFCALTCNECSLGDITNKHNFKINEDTVFGPGAMEFENSQCDILFNEGLLKSIGIKSYNEWPRYFGGGRIRLTAATIACDCKLYAFLAGLGTTAHKYWPNLLEGLGFICTSPERLAGTNLTALYLTGDYSELVCDMVNCPYPCRCQDRPHDGHVLVNCSGSGLTHFPAYMPTGQWGNSDVVLVLNDNRITTIEQRDYFHRVVDLDLKGNVITDIPSLMGLEFNEAAKLDLSGASNKPLKLPASFSHLSPLAINFGNNTLLCDCGSIWIRDWVVIHNRLRTITCSTPSGKMFAEDISEAVVGCEGTEEPNTYIIVILSVTVVLLVALVVFLRVFKYECFLLKRKLFNTKHTMHWRKRFDVTLSFAETNFDVNKFVHTYLGPTLEQEGYSVFARFSHVLPGHSLNPNELFAKGTEGSKNYIVILCPLYLKDENTVEEFNIIWNRYRSSKSSEIITINFDSVDTSDVPDRRLKAFLRLGKDLNYKSRHGSLMERLKHRIGPPQKGKSGKYEKKADCRFVAENFNSPNQTEKRRDVRQRHPYEEDCVRPQNIDHESDPFYNRFVSPTRFKFIKQQQWINKTRFPIFLNKGRQEPS